MLLRHAIVLGKGGLPLTNTYKQAVTNVRCSQTLLAK